MHDKMPKTPFATRFSGGAKEAELRIRNIFQWKKQRPPVWLFVLVLLAALGCAGLVSCQQEEIGLEEPGVELPGLTLGNGLRVYARVQEPEAAEEAIDDEVTALYVKAEDGTETFVGQIPYGPGHHYWDSVSLKEFQNVLGGNGVIVGYQMGSASYVMEYLALNDAHGERLAVAQNTAYEVDIDGDGQKELISNYGTLHELDMALLLDGEVVSCQLNETVRNDLGLDEYSWVELFYYEDTGLVTAAWTDPDGEKVNRTLEIGVLFELAKAICVPAPEREVRVEREELTGLTLDGVGTADDTALLEARLIPYKQAEESTVTLTVTLGSGEVLTHVWNVRAFPELTTARLTHPDRDSLVVELADATSNYAAEYTCVLDVADGRLVERLYFDGVMGGYIEEQGAAPLDSLRLADLVNTWHQPEYYTAVWNGTEFVMQADGFFTDTYGLGSYYGPDNAEMSLKLSLRGRVEDNVLVYDRVQIVSGDVVLQTIDPAPYLPVGNYDHGGFLAEGFTNYGAVDVRDVNFDGNPDFGLRCDETKNEGHAWFVWDQNAHKFVYLTRLGGALTIDDTIWQLREVVWDDSFEEQITNHYSISHSGSLVPLLHPAEEQPRFAAQTAAFEAVLLESGTVWDGDRERKITYTGIGTDAVFTPGWFSVVDMDRDGTPEVVLWMTLPGNLYVGFDILRWEDGGIVSYSEVYRGLQDLKQNGTFAYSSGASDNGIAVCTEFKDGTLFSLPLSWCQSSSAPPYVTYFAHNAPATQEQFYTALAEQSLTPDVVWYELTRENITLLGGLMAAAAG